MTAYATPDTIAANIRYTTFTASKELRVYSEQEQIDLFGAAIFGADPFRWDAFKKAVWVKMSKTTWWLFRLPEVAELVNETNRAAQMERVVQDRFAIEPAGYYGMYHVRDTVTDEFMSAPDLANPDSEIITMWLGEAIDLANELWAGVELVRGTWPAEPVAETPWVDMMDWIASVKAAEQAQPAYAKEIKYNPENRDFDMFLDKNLVGCAPTYADAEQRLDAMVFDALTKGQRP